MASKCIEWPHARDAQGYGMKRVGKKMVRIHRWVWEQANGPIPPGMVVRHKCDNRPCMNLKHLLLGTTADNNRDMIERGRHWTQKAETFGCGHPRSPENSKVRNKQKNWKECRMCFNDRMRPLNQIARARRKANAAIAIHS